MLAAQLNLYLARALKRSPRAQELCVALDGRRLRLQINHLPGTLWMAVANGALQVTHASTRPGTIDSAADVTIQGSPLGLLALAGSDASGAVMRGGAIVEGDETLVQQFQELARLLRPDIEAAAGQVVGRVPAHLATRALTLFTTWARAARESVARNAADYLAHESRDLVPRAEAEGYFSGVEALRSAVTRAEARVALLAERVAALNVRSTT
jgi:ubiquinone biosynthesis accessory factor UbiJ